MHEQTTIKQERKGAIHMEKVLNIEGMAVSYTHLDVYKRQGYIIFISAAWRSDPAADSMAAVPL